MEDFFYANEVLFLLLFFSFIFISWRLITWDRDGEYM